jgi:TolA-binding protein
VKNIIFRIDFNQFLLDFLTLSSLFSNPVAKPPRNVSSSRTVSRAPEQAAEQPPARLASSSEESEDDEPLHDMNEGDLQQQVFDLEDRIDDLEMENKKLRAQIELKDLVSFFIARLENLSTKNRLRDRFFSLITRQVSKQGFKGPILYRKTEQGFKAGDRTCDRFQSLKFRQDRLLKQDPVLIESLS